MNKRVVVLGGTGMLGAMMVEVLGREPQLDVTATRRVDGSNNVGHTPIAWRRLDAATATVEQCRTAIKGATWIINCIGITKPLIAEDDAVKVEAAIRVNSLFPHVLASAAQTENARVIQIATDCVYSGSTGNYCENSAHDALDVYGKTKSLGEVSSSLVHHLRASIIGPEPKDHKFLLDWFLGQPRSASVNGFTNHDWNGVTTLHFSRIALGIIRNETALPRLHHLIPSGRITKAAMLECFSRSYGRKDVTIKSVHAGSMIDRTLTTTNDSLNQKLWSDAGYAASPTVEKMIEEIAQFQPRFAHPAAA